MSRVGFSADVAAVYSDGDTALHVAAWAADYDAVASQLLRANANAHAVNNDGGHTALYVAAYHGRARVADAPLQANACTTAENNGGRTRCRTRSATGTVSSRSDCGKHSGWGPRRE